MKKTNKNNELQFNKTNITELNDNKLYEVNGGTTWNCVSILSVLAWNAGVQVGHAISNAIDNLVGQEQQIPNEAVGGTVGLQN